MAAKIIHICQSCMKRRGTLFLEYDDGTEIWVCPGCELIMP